MYGKKYPSHFLDSEFLTQFLFTNNTMTRMIRFMLNVDVSMQEIN